MNFFQCLHFFQCLDQNKHFKMASDMSDRQHDRNKFDNMLAHKFALAEINHRYNMSYTFAKPKQIQLLFEAFRGDTLALLPTGFGKSLVFEMLPYYVSSLNGSFSCCIIVCPLNAIIIEKWINTSRMHFM